MLHSPLYPCFTRATAVTSSQEFDRSHLICRMECLDGAWQSIVHCIRNSVLHVLCSDMVLMYIQHPGDSTCPHNLIVCTCQRCIENPELPCMCDGHNHDCASQASSVMHPAVSCAVMSTNRTSCIHMYAQRYRARPERMFAMHTYMHILTV